MTDKMTIAYLKQTRNVLAAFTRVSDPEAKPTPEQLGPGLLVRGLPDSTGVAGDQQFEVPADELDLEVVDLEATVLLQPSAFYLDDTTAVVPTPATSFSATLTATQATVSGFPAGGPETKVWVEISGGNLTEPLIAKGVLPANAVSVALPIEALSPAAYQVLALAKGFQVYVTDATVV
jgi:hypothetical protein